MRACVCVCYLSMTPPSLMALFQSFRVAFPAMCTNCLGLMSWLLNCEREKEERRKRKKRRGEEKSKQLVRTYNKVLICSSLLTLNISTHFHTWDIDSRTDKLLKEQNRSAVSTGDGVAVLNSLSICLTVI